MQGVRGQARVSPRERTAQQGPQARVDITAAEGMYVYSYMQMLLLVTGSTDTMTDTVQGCVGTDKGSTYVV
jgi:hypothetical protein